MIIRMNRRLAPQFPTHHLDRPITNHFIHIHIRLRSRSGLENDQRKLVDQFTADDFVGRVRDGSRDVGIQAVRLVHVRGGFFEDAEGFDEGWGHAFGGSA